MEGRSGGQPEAAHVQLSQRQVWALGVKPEVGHAEMSKDRVGHGLGATAGALCSPCGVGAGACNRWAANP